MNSIENASVPAGTRVFVRADLDVPIENGKIKETFRLDFTLPTLLLLAEKKAKIIIAGHMDRPKGQFIEELSTKQLLPYFNEKLGEANFELLENLRFDPREEANDMEFAKDLASKADIYVNECFSTSHRNHTSFVGIPKLLPSYAGLRLMQEVDVLSKVLKNPQRPLVTIVGGTKVETKKPAILQFLKIADFVLVGGKIGKEWNEDIPSNLYLPLDDAEEGKDIGPKTIEVFSQIISKAKTVVWAAPLGVYEEDKFIKGTNEVAQAVINSNAYSIAGGGDIVAALNKLGLSNKFSFISTGGGAMLEFLIKGNLPGLEALGYHG